MADLWIENKYLDMLHDPSHITPPEVAREINLKPFEKDAKRLLEGILNIPLSEDAE